MQFLRVLSGHQLEVQSVSISHDGNYVISVSRDKTICIYGMLIQVPLQVLHRLEGHLDAVTSVVISQHGTRLVSGSNLKDTTVRIWDAAADIGTVLHELKRHSVFTFRPISSDVE